MKAKTIKSVLRRKVDDWLLSIEDGAVRDLAARNTIVTGGSIASMLLGEKVNDFDLYFQDKETALAIATYYVNKFVESPPSRLQGQPLCAEVKDEGDRVSIFSRIDVGIEEFSMRDPNTSNPLEYMDDVMIVAEACEEKPSYRPVFLSSNAITLSDKIQLVIRFYGDPDEIHENYDFVHCINYWTSWNNELVLNPKALECLLTRELLYQGSLYPICSVIRTRKFVKRGWTITAGQYLKMCMQISKLDLEDIKVLEEQLTGVDVFYFLEVLRVLKEKDTERIDHTYLMEIIDRMF